MTSLWLGRKTPTQTNKKNHQNICYAKLSLKFQESKYLVLIAGKTEFVYLNGHINTLACCCRSKCNDLERYKRERNTNI